MGIINIFMVQSAAESKGWKLLSESYKNLKTPLEWECPEGHKIQETYDEWRKTQICPECQKLKTGGAVRNEIIPKKNPNDFRVLALDAATGTTGYSIYDDKKLVAYGTYSPVYTADSTARINQIKHWLEEVCQICQPDAIGIEGIQYQSQHGVKTFQTLANLQGVLLDFFYENKDKYQYSIVSSSAWRSYLGLNHGEVRESVKERTQNYVKLVFRIDPTQDEADAICLGYYLVNHLKDKREVTWGEDIL